MSERRDALRAWKKLLDGKQNLDPVRFALTGDGSGAVTSDVSGRPGWAWVRYDEEQNKVSQVRNRRFPGIPEDVPVVIGKEFATDRYVQILGVNWPLYDMFMTDPTLISYLTPPHGDSHHAVFGSDPAYLDIRNILNGRVRPTSPSSLSVQIDSFAFEYQDTRELFAGGAVDLTSYVPSTTDWHGYVLVTFDTIERSLHVVPGTAGPITMPASLPGIPIWHIPLGAVLMYEGITEIDEIDVYDLRIAFEPIGKYNTYRNFVQYMQNNDEMWTRHLSGDF